jgi:hypothetical protein
MSGKESRNCNEPAFGYKVRTDCNVDSAMYELIDSNRIIDFNFSFGDGSYVQYSPTIQHLKRHDKSSYFPKEYYMIIERETEYAKFKTNHSNNIDFENNILFIVFLDSYGTCIGNRRPEITLSLLLDKMNNN